MKEPNRKDKPTRKRTPKRKPNGLQWQLDQELQEKIRSQENLPEPGEGESLINYVSRVEQEMGIPIPPTPLPQKPCLYEHPGTRETIRRKLKELGVTNVHQLIRNYQAAELIEAISDYERALDDGFRVRYPTAYFRSLLK